MEKPRMRFFGPGFLWLVVGLLGYSVSLLSGWPGFAGALVLGGVLGWLAREYDKYQHLMALLEYEHKKFWKGEENVGGTKGDTGA